MSYLPILILVSHREYYHVNYILLYSLFVSTYDIYCLIHIIISKKIDSIQRRAVRILFKLKRNDITIYIFSIMAIIGRLKFRDICNKFRLLCITHEVIYGSYGIPIKESQNSSNFSSDSQM